MSPIALSSTADVEDDDFIRTLSDNDANDLDLEEEESHIRPSLSTEVSANGTGSKKRKRATDSSQVNGASKKRKGKKSLGESAVQAKVLRTSDDDELGEDDGAMNPDFVFQVETYGDQVLDNFDGWDLENDKPSAKGANKTGVDLEALIAKRKKKIDAAGAEAGTRERDDLSSSEEDRGDDDMNDEEGEDAMEELIGDDELLAQDTFGMGASLNGVAEDASQDDQQDGSDEADSAEDSDSEDAVADPMPEPDSADESEDQDAEEVARRKEFFAPEEESQAAGPQSKSTHNAFQSMSLSRPVLRGLGSVGFNTPTPIQSKTIPIALQGKDLVGGAVTGSGKTAAFVIPILERLMYRPKKVPTSRVAILVPTRELAVQCLNVAKKLASFTDISFCLLTGGFSLREQEQTLRTRPDVIVATPGRFIDHMRNSASFTTDTLEILVLDEADRMLDDGFADELDEIMRTIPTSRQTMLFSATMTEQVDKLIRAGLKKPVRLMADARKQTVGTLTQEFVRLRPGREDKRLAYLAYLCSTVYKDRVIIFFRQKKETHRARILFGLLNIKAAELHGSMSQEQRINALTTFRSGQATHLLATDLASRGLDIPLISVVINYEAPQSHEIYLHRVGRTARAGRVGRSCTIAAETDRKIVKQAVRAAKSQGAKVASRVVDAELADQWAKRVVSLDDEIETILKEEKEEKLLNQTDMSIRKGENIIKHEDEIHARPKRTWFESEKEKLKAKRAGKEELNGQVGLRRTKSSGKLSEKDKKALDDKRERVEGRLWKKGKGDGAKSKRSGGPSSHKTKGKRKK